jgi:hypothetical protein
MHTIEHNHAEPGLEIQKEQVWEEYGCPQAQSCEETNIPFFLARKVPVHPTKYPLTFGFQSIFILQIDCVLSL